MNRECCCPRIEENDTHHCFELSTDHESYNVENSTDDLQCIVYFKSLQNVRNQWFIYEKQNMFLIRDSSNVGTNEDFPLLFDDHDDTNLIYNDCQCAIFFIGRPEHRLKVGMISHLLMDSACLVNIGLCPIGGHTQLPKKIKDGLNSILDHDKSKKGSMVLHTLLIGKISDEQKYARIITKPKSIPDWHEQLKMFLKRKLPSYMIPSYFMHVSEFVLNANGKVDRNALPEISTSVIHEENAYVPPRSELEKTIARDMGRIDISEKIPGKW